MATEPDVARHELTAKRAYEIWERNGHPHDRAWEHWLQAEAELRAEQERNSATEANRADVPEIANETESGEPSGPRRRSWQEGGQSDGRIGAGTQVAAVHGGRSDAPRAGEQRDSIEGDGRIAALGEAPPASNLDRSLPPEQRAKVRAQRHEIDHRGPPPAPEPAPAEHFIVLADHASLKIFVEDKAPGQRTPALRSVQTQVFPQGHESYSDRDTSQQGRFPNHGRQGMSPGMSIDERLPMQQEQERRLVGLIAAALNAFLRQHPNATWDFAAGPGLHRTVVEKVEPTLRKNIRKVLPKDLSKQPLSSLRVHLAGAAPFSP